MSDRAMKGHDTGEDPLHNTGQNVKEFVKEINGREKQSVALMIAMGGLYLCPEVVEAILNPVEGQEKHILDIGPWKWLVVFHMHQSWEWISFLLQYIQMLPLTYGSKCPISTSECPASMTNSTLFTLEASEVELRIWTERSESSKVDGDMVFYESRNKPTRMKRLPGDPDVSGATEDGSWLQRMVAEAWEVSAFNGADMTRYCELVDLGLWDYPSIDPETARAGGIYLPVGPWAKDIETESLQYGGELMQKVLLNIHRAYHSRLLQCGMGQEVLDEWSSNIDD
ncbi:6159_t:CDS:2, partial [Acaulospora colombiana]